LFLHAKGKGKEGENEGEIVCRIIGKMYTILCVVPLFLYVEARMRVMKPLPDCSTWLVMGGLEETAGWVSMLVWLW